MDNIIKIRGARTNNLKNIDIDIKINQITCFVGPSGSGKTSLAFGTLYQEAKRRFINSFPTDIKFFWDVPNIVDVDFISPVLPVWALPQNNSVASSRPCCSDALGVTELLQKEFYLKSFAICPKHKMKLKSKSWLRGAKEIVTKKNNPIFHVLLRREDYENVFTADAKPARSYCEGENQIRDFHDEDAYWEIFRTKNFESLDAKLAEIANLKGQRTFYLFWGENLVTLRKHLILSCPECDYFIEKKELTPEYFNPWNALGACSECQGHGAILKYDKRKLIPDDNISLKNQAITFLKFSPIAHAQSLMLKEIEKAGFDIEVPFKHLDSTVWDLIENGVGKFPGLHAYYDYIRSKWYKKNYRIYARNFQSEFECPLCSGSRLTQEINNYAIDVNHSDFLTLPEIVNKNIEFIYKNICKDERIQTCIKMGLGHLDLNRKTKTLSSSEYQRLLLCKYLSFKESGSLFVLDEPGLGLDEDNQKIIMNILYDLREQGNTIVLVEHSPLMQLMSDEIVELGPESGARGGKILYQGKFKKRKSDFEINLIGPKSAKKYLEIKKACIWNLPIANFKIPLGALTCVYGPVGSGKTSILLKTVADELNYMVSGKHLYIDHGSCNIKGNVGSIEDVFVSDYKLTKMSGRSTIGSFVGVSPYVRKHYADLEISKSLGLKDGNFSSNSELGKCPTCEGRGFIEVDMHFMESLEFTCEDCQGKRIRRKFADISDGQLTAYEAFSLPMSNIMERMKLTPKLRHIWSCLQLLNLDYLSLDRTVNSLSGGEKQRLNLLSKIQGQVKNSILFLENPSFGLAFEDVKKLDKILSMLLSLDNTVVIIDPNPLIKRMSPYHLKFQEDSTAIEECWQKS